MITQNNLLAKNDNFFFNETYTLLNTLFYYLYMNILYHIYTFFNIAS